MLGKDVFGTLPLELKDELLESYREIKNNYSQGRWEPAELNGGKFCEVVYSITKGILENNFPRKATKPNNMADACRALEQIPQNGGRAGDRSLRILIPRILLPLYEIRNNRGVGHVGGDVNPNFMDATTVYEMSSWILGELIRILHGISTMEAQSVVDSLMERKHPLIWKIEGIKRVLNPNLNKRDQTILLLYSEPGWVNENDLLNWVEYTNSSVFRRDILVVLHKKRLVEYDKKNRNVRLSPMGISDVEKRILKENDCIESTSAPSSQKSKRPKMKPKANK
jgi:hypothetical protein